MLFLKSALGQEIQCTVERGGGAQAQFLASRRRRRHKKMDAAATRVGSSLPLHRALEEERIRKEVALKKVEKEENGRKLMKAGDTFDFLKDNIGLNGRNGLTTISESLAEEDFPDVHNPSDLLDEQVDSAEMTLSDETAEMQTLPEDDRVTTFQNQYKVELDRQVDIIRNEANIDPLASPLHSVVSEDDVTICWEDVDV